MFADILPEAIKWNRNRTNALCFATALPDHSDFVDGSDQVASALQARFTETYPGLLFLQKSKCSKSTKGDNLYFMDERVDPSLQGTPHDCHGEYEAIYTKGSGGGAYNYNVQQSGDTATLERTAAFPASSMHLENHGNLQT